MELHEIFHRDTYRTASTFSDANEAARDLLQNYESGEVGDGTYTYDDDSGTVKRFMVAGGGPSAWVVFVRIGDNLTAHLEYADSTGRVIVALPDHRTNEMLSAFRTDAEARNTR
jgi:hypothetical protein